LALIVTINNAGSTSKGEVLFAVIVIVIVIAIAIAVLRQYWRRLLSLRMLLLLRMLIGRNSSCGNRQGNRSIPKLFSKKILL